MDMEYDLIVIGSGPGRGSLGTARFGTDPRNSVLDLDCRTHDLENLYIADAGFFPSIAAVNPTLTIIVNALRVADRIKERWSS